MQSNSSQRRTHGGDKTIEELGPPPRDDLANEMDVEDDEEDVSEDDLLEIAKHAISANENGEFAVRRAVWDDTYRAYRNKHFHGSRYTKKEYGARSRLFIPKTRTAVRKAMTAAAAALFSTDNVVVLSAQNPSNPQQVANAKLNHALIDYRLDRSSDKEGIPWFMTSMGACQEATLVGMCCSKQFWTYQEVDGEVIRDKPEIRLIPLDDIGLDPAASWVNPVQTGGYFYCKYPMRVDDVQANMHEGSNPLGGGPWRDVPDKVMGRAVEDYRGRSTRTARQGGVDRYGSQSQITVKGFDIVWVYEFFIRKGGRDYHFWSLNGDVSLSEPQRTDEAYPAHNGERPYVLGYGALEAHNLYPVSGAEAMQPLQNEINDIRNLRIDTVRQAISPIAKVRRGNKVDLRALTYRGPDATILVKDQDDVTFDRAPDASASSFAEADRLNADIDELTGSFSTSTVQSSRSLNETVGGMQLMANTGNAVTEFDLRVWIETWVEPVLRQLVRLQQYYETNEELIALAANTAGVVDDGFNPAAVDIDGPLMVKVDVGIGAADPMQKLQKFVSATKIALELGTSGVLGGQVQPKAEEIFAELYGLSGYRDISRFFNFKDPEQAKAEAEQRQKEGPSPVEMEKVGIDKMKADTERMKVEAEIERGREEIRIKLLELQSRGQIEQGKLEVEGAYATMKAIETSVKQDESERRQETEQDERLFGRQERAIERNMRMQERQAPRPDARGA